MEPTRPPAPHRAALYAALHHGNPGDVDYYRRVCVGAASVLELGCGWGRIAHTVAADGPDVVGLERDDALRSRGPSGPAQLQAGDMRSFHLQRTFDRVIIPYNGLYCLWDEQALLSCLRCVREHLAPEGLVVFDAYPGDTFHFDPEAVPGWDALEPVARLHVDGRAWVVHEQSWWDPDHQRIDARYLYVPVDGGEPVEAVIRQRYLLSREVPALLAAAGLHLVALQGGFDQAAYDPDGSEMLIVVAGRAPDGSSPAAPSASG